MSPLQLLAHLAVLLCLPVLMVGVINRTKARWAGRKGPPLLQTFFDLRRLVQKRPVYSKTTTIMIVLGPLVVLATSILSGMMVPLLGRVAPLSFRFDFVAVAYLWGLGRISMMLAALDTGSPFEGMGASREASFAAVVEPAFFLVTGALAAATGNSSFAGLLQLGYGSIQSVIVTVAAVLAIFVVLTVEAARVPVDDPTTHLELTMIHEVMILDHSGPDLAALQYGAATKLTLCAAMIASLVNPLASTAGPVLVATANVALMLCVAVTVGCVESLVARFKLVAVPQYVLVALIAASTALLSTLGASGSVP